MSLPFDSADSQHSSKRFLLRLVAIVAVLNAIVIALALLALHKSRVRYEERALTAATTIAVFQERDLASTVEQVDLVLQTIADEALETKSGAADGSLGAFILRQAARLPALHGLRITNAQGDVTEGLGMVKGSHANLADRAYFKQLAHEPGAGIVISKPLVSRVSGEWEIVLARRLNGRDGQFDGVVYATIPLQYFVDKFAAIDLGAHGVIALRDAQLGVIARWPSIRSITQDVGSRTVAAAIRDAVASGATSGTYSGQAGSDGVERTMSYRRIGALPMFIVVGLGKADYLADWHAEVMRATALASLFAFVTLVFTVTIHRSWRRREADVDALALQERKFRTLLDSSPDGLVIADTDGMIELVNRNAERMFGYAADALVGQPMRMLLPARFAGFSLTTPGAVGDAGEAAAPRDLWAVTKDGREFPIGISVSAIATEQGGLVAAAIRDMSERHASARHIEFLAHHDALTGLPNRAVMEARFEQAVAHAGRSGTQVALMFLDLDSFKTVNDSLGHPVGDELLKGVALRLGRFARASDIVSRQGGDEFLIVFTGLRDGADIAVAAERLMQQFKAPFFVESHEIATSLSVGIALYPQDGADFPTLLKKADIAMYQAKAAGRDAYRLFDDHMHVEALGRHRIRIALHHAIERDEFRLHYQPQIDLRTGQVVGAEALLRWNNAELGAVSPAEFIPVAEESGLIVPIGDWVLHEACRQAVAWQRPGRPPLTVAVNISAVQFARGDLEDTVRRALASSGLAPALLELELTESILIRNVDSVLATVMRLKRLGVMLSIDDFGTGYSSLTYLKRFAVDKLKIDQSFIRDLMSDAESGAIVQAIVQMARSLNLKTVAEGIEDDGVLAHLKSLACDQGQGYLIARPMPALALLEFLEDARERVVEASVD